MVYQQSEHVRIATDNRYSGVGWNCDASGLALENLSNRNIGINLCCEKDGIPAVRTRAEHNRQ